MTQRSNLKYYHNQNLLLLRSKVELHLQLHHSAPSRRLEKKSRKHFTQEQRSVQTLDRVLIG